LRFSKKEFLKPERRPTRSRKREMHPHWNLNKKDGGQYFGEGKRSSIHNKWPGGKKKKKKKNKIKKRVMSVKL